MQITTQYIYTYQGEPKRITIYYIDGNITCTLDGEPCGEYTMGASMIVGSALLSADIRRAIHAKITMMLKSAMIDLG
jgi:hypothetical protein